MRYVDRGIVDEPEVLKKKYNKGTKFDFSGTEFDRAVFAFTGATKGKGFKFNRYSEYEVKENLVKLFHGKCAYCESQFSATQPVDVEHYRPKGNVASKHGDQTGYWWLAADWGNLLPSCIDCNRHRKQILPDLNETNLPRVWNDVSDGPILMGKQDHFPIADETTRAVFNLDELKCKNSLNAEKRLLLDPTRDNPEKFISFNLGYLDKWSLVLPWAKGSERNEVGWTSINVYGLNRLGLVQARTRLLRQLEFYLELASKLTTLNHNVMHRLSMVEAKRAQENLTSKQEATLIENQNFYNSTSATLKSMKAEIIKRIEKLMDEKQPYSSLVRAWLVDKRTEFNI